MRLVVNKVALLGLLAAGLCTPGLFGQRRPAPAVGRPGAGPRPGPMARPTRPLGPRPRPANPAANPAAALDRWNQMSPEERERALQKLPPERQKQIRDRIAQFNREFNKLPKEEQDRLRQRAERFAKLPPEQQAAVRADIQRFNQLPPERKQALSQEFEGLRKMPENQRQVRLNSEEFRGKYSPEEQQMVRDLEQILAPTPK